MKSMTNKKRDFLNRRNYAGQRKKTEQGRQIVRDERQKERERAREKERLTV